MSRKTCPLIVSALLLAAAVPVAGDWMQFRGPNGSGVSDTTGLPVEMGAEKNLVWRTALPPGHSSPVLAKDRIFLTAFEGDALLTLSIDRKSGKVLWRREAPRPREEKVDQRNTPASPSPVTDGKSVFVFFPDFGLLAYDLEGKELWRLPLGPFHNVYGMGASPILADGKVVLVCDQSLDSFLLAVDKASGSIAWKTPRPEATSGHSTPVLYTTPEGETQVVVPGSFLLTAYSAKTGEKVWWVRGLSFEMKSTPVIQDGLLFINGYGSPMNQPGEQIDVPTFQDFLAADDANGNGVVDPNELPEEPLASWFGFVDLDGSGQLAANEWEYLRAALASLNGMLAIRLGGQGDMTESAVAWQYRRNVPQLPSPLVYQDVLYMVNDGGIATSFRPATGEVIRQGRVQGALGQYYASPVAADGKVYFLSRDGKLAVLKPDGGLEVTAVNDLGEACYATPALDGGRIYVRTEKALYCFGKKAPA